ncbi:hypothetical protein ACOME3_001170 [Neoechinorhynchus agilis]
MLRKLMEFSDENTDDPTDHLDPLQVPILRLSNATPSPLCPTGEWRVVSRGHSANCVIISSTIPDWSLQEKEEIDLMIPIAPLKRPPKPVGMRCWIDPAVIRDDPDDGAFLVSKELQKQYELLQPNLRFEHTCNKPRDDIAKLLRVIRHRSPNERMLIHYSGYGILPPKDSGELHFLNGEMRDYVPVSITDIHRWVSNGPAIVVVDADNSGAIIKAEVAKGISDRNDHATGKIPLIVLTSCDIGESVPKSDKIPLDVFTSCLTTPLRTMAHLYRLSNRATHFTSFIEKQLNKRAEIKGDWSTINDRKSKLGELNWAYTAVTDAIAWSLVDRHLFKCFFRQNSLVASLFRNYLLACRLLPEFGMHPKCYPPIFGQSTQHVQNHPLWDSWDCTIEARIVHENFTSDCASPAFEVSLRTEGAMSIDVSTPSIPILLQVLLSQGIGSGLVKSSSNQSDLCSINAFPREILM